ncbi:MAG: DUF2142 domain-containing protein [Ruminococcus sp.]|jgi:4-amino-4-deoxy-L-arabinose transferase-like glycosyltransferase
MKSKIKPMLPEIIFLAAVFVFLFLWAVVQPYDTSPDERMRFDIVKYLVKYGKIPHGGDPAIRDANWGISYAFNPILAYMMMAVFVKIAGLFTSQLQTLVMAARLVNILLGCATAFVLLRLSRFFFRKWLKWLFVILVMFLPGTMFVFSYVNTDGLALFSVVLILLFWARAMKAGWTWKNCAGLAAGISLCALSYYNAYGIILASIIFFAADILFFREKKWNFSFLFQRGLVIAAIVAILAGWWFVRSYVIYDGDILGMKTSSMYSEMYAIEELKPGNQFLFSKTGMSVWDMFFYVPGNWPHNWLIMVAVSFVGTFGYMDVFMPYWLSKCYFLLFGLGAAGILIRFRRTFFLREREIIRTRKKMGDSIVKIRCVRMSAKLKTESLFHICLAVSAVIPGILLVYYAYCSDFQAQGRYLLPGMPALMYFATLGIENLLEKITKKEKTRQMVCLVMCVLFIGAAVFTYAAVVYPHYAPLL